MVITVPTPAQIAVVNSIARFRRTLIPNLLIPGGDVSALEDLLAGGAPAVSSTRYALGDGRT